MNGQRHARMISIIGIERTHANTRVMAGVVCEFCDGQEVGPIIL